MFEMDNIRLSFTDDALVNRRQAIIKTGTWIESHHGRHFKGAFELPSHKDVSECVIN